MMLPAILIIVVVFIIAEVLFPFFRYIVPRFYLVMGDSMYPTLAEGDVVMGLKPRPTQLLENGGIYGYQLPLDEKKWVIKRLIYQTGDKCFFLGDNSNNSIDSRDYGLVDRSKIMFEVVWYKDMRGR